MHAPMGRPNPNPGERRFTWWHCGAVTPKSAPFACLPFEPRSCRPTHQPTLTTCLQLNLDVIEATNGQEGLLAYLRHGRDQIAFVFLDLVMPVWDGFRAALSIRRCAQTLRVHSGLHRALHCTACNAGTEARQQRQQQQQQQQRQRQRRLHVTQAYVSALDPPPAAAQ